MPAGENPNSTKGQSGIIRAALLGLCPRCGGKTLFEAPSRIALRCDECQLDLGRLERGGRLAGVLTAFIAIVLMVIALWVEAAFRPPIVLQAAFWAPATLVIVIASLRWFKTALLYAAYSNSQSDSE